MNIDNIIAIVPAAGSGSRMMSQIPKQYLTIADKKIIEITIEKLLSVEAVSNVVVAVSKDDEWWESLAVSQAANVHTCSGGLDRSVSVKNALQYCKENLIQGDVGNSWALVHDAARPCVIADKINELIAKAQSFVDDPKNQELEFKRWHVQGAILGCPVSDTVKRVSQSHIITATEDRSELWLAHTPQLFPLSFLYDALDYCHKNGVLVTDEASAIETFGGRVMVVNDHRDNIKITYAEDLVWAQQIFQQ